MAFSISGARPGPRLPGLAEVWWAPSPSRTTPHLEEVHRGGSDGPGHGLPHGSDALTLTVSADNPVPAENNVLYAKQQTGTHWRPCRRTRSPSTGAAGTVQIDAQAFRNNKAPAGRPARGPQGRQGRVLQQRVVADRDRPARLLEAFDGLYPRGSSSSSSARGSAPSVRTPSRQRAGPDDDRARRRGRLTGSTDSPPAPAPRPFFGEGMERINYGYGALPADARGPSTLAELALGTYALSAEQLAASHVRGRRRGVGRVVGGQAAVEKAGLPSGVPAALVRSPRSPSSPAIDRAGTPRRSR